ncbi:GNAT family N-acetyltransferase [Vibrio cyclitrophicus]
MFKVKVDDEIELFLVHENFAKEYSRLAAENREYLSQWLEWPRHCSTEEDFNKFAQGSLVKHASGTSMNCAIFYRNELVGNIGFNKILRSVGRVEIGYWLAEKFQGKGIINRSCSFLINYAFTELSVEKVQISAAEENISSRSVCERLGMTLEGTLSNQEKVGESIYSHAIYGIWRK